MISATQPAPVVASGRAICAAREASVKKPGSPAYRPEGHETVSADALFSLRARRRFAAYLRMRLLEMREAGLARAADAVERGLPVEQLLAPER
jgi:hypothetical protein